MKKKKKSDKKGFTLIELLAIILILALVVSIVVYVVTDVVKNAKDNSYEVTVNNIVNVASEFVLENSSDKISWVDSDAQYQYTCVSVQDLIDGGYYKSDVLDSYINDTDKVSADDYIELKRNKTSKNIEVKRLLTKEEDKALCNNIDDSIIQISVFKHDECDEINGWSKCKLVNIKYQITNISKPIVDYKYGYDFLKDGVVEEFKVEDISFTKNLLSTISPALIGLCEVKLL